MLMLLCLLDIRPYLFPPYICLACLIEQPMSNSLLLAVAFNRSTHLVYCEFEVCIFLLQCSSHDFLFLFLNLGSGRNIFSLLAQREISPRNKHVRKCHWGESSESKSGCSRSRTVVDAKCGLLSWYLHNFSPFSV